MSDAQAKIEITAGTARLPAALQRAKKMFLSFAETVGGGTRDLFKGIAKGVLLGTGMTIANRGIDLMIEQGKAVIDFQRELTRLGIDLRKQPAEMEGIGAAMRQISNETGIGAEKVLAAGRAYADLAGAEAFTMDKMRLIARAAQASGSDVSDMAALMFTLTENMKVPPNQLEDTIGGLINQAKDGSIHFKELAKELVALGSVYSQFGVTGREGAIQIGAQMQLARHGFASASEAATGVLRIYRSLPQHASKFAKAGVDIWMPGSRTKLRPFEDIIHQIQKSKLSLDRELLIKSFGRTEGERFYQVLTALAGQYDQLKHSGEANGVIQKDLATYTESAAGRMDIAMQRVKNSFAEALTPERIDQIVSGIESIAGAMPAIVSSISTVMDAFTGMIFLMRKAADLWSGSMSEYRWTPEEARTIQWRPNTPEFAKLQTKAAVYKDAMADISSKESPTGATRASIEAAVRDAASDKEGVRAAGEAYLKGVPAYIIATVREKIAKQDSAEAGDRLKARDNQGNPYSKRYMQIQAQDAFMDQIGSAVKEGMIAAMQSGAFAFPVPVVSMDGNKTGSALDNSYRYRKR